jgi:hypothetical protein
MEDFEAVRFAPAWQQLATSTGSKCTDCHGAYSAKASFPIPQQQLQFFVAITTHRAVLEKFFWVDPSLVTPAVVVNAPVLDRVATSTVPQNEHPGFPVDNPGRMAVDELFSLTEQHLFDGECGPPTLAD